MTVPPRGARNRRGGRRPGWLLLTALLVLAILASSTLVFTSSVQLLRLAVILSLWAAVLAAFVSVLYRRQSEADQARARDMKFVYDLQLDREISARREYELGVEAHLRRQMARERGQAAEELVALRAELASLRANLEVLLGADLGERPAIESDRTAAAAAGLADAFVMPPPPGRVESSRVTDEAIEQSAPVVEEVVEEYVELAVDVVAAAESPIIDVPEEPLAPPHAPRPEQPFAPYPPDGYRGSHRRTEPPAQPPPPQPVYSPPSGAPWRPPETQPRRGRHWTPEQTPAPARPAAPAPVPAASDGPDGPRGRHWVPDSDVARAAAAASAGGRHRDAVEPVVEETQEPSGQHTGGHSVADLMARLNMNNAVGGGGRRRRRED